MRFTWTEIGILSTIILAVVGWGMKIEYDIAGVSSDIASIQSDQMARDTQIIQIENSIASINTNIDTLLISFKLDPK